jgi:hypothetical protein
MFRATRRPLIVVYASVIVDALVGDAIDHCLLAPRFVSRTAMPGPCFGNQVIIAVPVASDDVDGITDDRRQCPDIRLRLPRPALLGAGYATWWQTISSTKCRFIG